MYRITIIRSLPFLFPDDFEGNANISVAIKSGSTVSTVKRNLCAILHFLRNDLQTLSDTIS